MVVLTNNGYPQVFPSLGLPEWQTGEEMDVPFSAAVDLLARPADEFVIAAVQPDEQAEKDAERLREGRGPDEPEPEPAPEPQREGVVPSPEPTPEPSPEPAPVREDETPPTASTRR